MTTKWTRALSEDAAHKKGYLAYKCGTDVCECPYPRATDERTLWIIGWVKASDEAAVSPPAPPRDIIDEAIAFLSEIEKKWFTTTAWGSWRVSVAHDLVEQGLVTKSPQGDFNLTTLGEEVDRRLNAK
jgi:ribosome modulation factor